jgi:alkanesulfonate monooxygenase SsuD/methylene tetrahydromethanopterin reductase-like flavin-dependent oxidoreductase (luciferase family)
MLSALAEATNQVELGTLVVCNSFRNPAILAKMATTLDEVCGGRLILGVGAGWNQPEYNAFGIPFDYRVSRFEEALQIIRPLLKEGYTDFEGKYYRAKDCEIRPRGPRPAGPPLMVGCGEPRMLRLTAKYADQWNIGYMSTPDTLLPHLEHMKAACKEVGRDISTLEITALVALGFPDLIDKLPEFENGVLTGDNQTLAETMRAYEEMGVSHLMFHVVPYRREALERLAEVVQVYHTHK